MATRSQPPGLPMPKENHKLIQFDYENPLLSPNLPVANAPSAEWSWEGLKRWLKSFLDSNLLCMFFLKNRAVEFLIDIFVEILHFLYDAFIGALKSCIRESNWICCFYDIICFIIKRLQGEMIPSRISRRIDLVFDRIWDTAVKYSTLYIGNFYIPYVRGHIKCLFFKYLRKILRSFKPSIDKNILVGSFTQVAYKFLKLPKYNLIIHALFILTFMADFIAQFMTKCNRVVELYRRPNWGKFLELYPFPEMMCSTWTWLKPHVDAAAKEISQPSDFRPQYFSFLLPCFILMLCSIFQEFISYEFQKLTQDPSKLLDLL